MTKWIVSVITLAVAFGVLQLFSYEFQRQSLAIARREASLCLQERMALQHRVAELEGMLNAIEQTNVESETALAFKEWEFSSHVSAYDEFLRQLDEEIASGQVRIERLQDRLTIDIISETLFLSGEVEFTEAGEEMLRKVGNVLTTSQPLRVIAQQHAGDIPIVDRLPDVDPTSLGLSEARVANVVRFLQDVVGLDPALLSVSACSGYNLKEDSRTVGDRAKNRSIELVLVPLPKPKTQQEGHPPLYEQ